MTLDECVKRTLNKYVNLSFYLHRERNRVRVLSLNWLVPSAVCLHAEPSTSLCSKEIRKSQPLHERMNHAVRVTGMQSEMKTKWQMQMWRGGVQKAALSCYEEKNG